MDQDLKKGIIPMTGGSLGFGVTILIWKFILKNREMLPESTFLLAERLAIFAAAVFVVAAVAGTGIFFIYLGAWKEYRQDGVIEIYTVTEKRKLKKLKIRIWNEPLYEDLRKILKPLTAMKKILTDKKSEFYNEYIDTYCRFTPYIEELVSSVNAWNIQYRKAKEEKESTELEKTFAKEMEESIKPAIKHMAEEFEKIKGKETLYKIDYKNAEDTLEKQMPVKTRNAFSDLQDIPVDTEAFTLTEKYK